jgi:hypothetical protein
VPDRVTTDSEESRHSAKAEEPRVSVGRSTRASTLKFEGARRSCEVWTIESKRQQLNEDIRRSRQHVVSERLQNVVSKLNPQAPTVRMLQIRKEKLMERSREWDNWLAATAKAMDQRGSMLGRLFFTSLERDVHIMT